MMLTTNMNDSSHTLYYNKHFNIHISPFDLRFSDDDMERQFKSKFNQENVKPSRFGMILAILLFAIYAIVDTYTYPESYEQLWLIRVLVDIVILGMLFYSYQDNYAIHMQSINTIFGLFLGLSLLYLFSFPLDSSLAPLFVASYVLVVIGLFVAIGLRFINAFSLVILLNILIFIIIFLHFDLIYSILLAILFLSTTLLSAVGAYFSEINRRKLFLQSLYTDELFVNLKKVEADLKEQVNRDPLTNLYNRRYLNTFSIELIKLSHRNKRRLSIIMLDIDRFKKINDTYGHKIGDDVIILLAALLTKNTRDSDLVFRVGGEEFALLLPDTNKEGAVEIASKLKDIVDTQMLHIDDDDHDVHFTISLGVSCVPPEESNIEVALMRADRALYAAKNNGRNRVEVDEND